jgi:hypothetical protein
LGVLPEGYIYPKQERPVRDLLRKRSQLVRQRTANLSEWKSPLYSSILEELWRAIMRKHAFSTAEDVVSIRVPKKLAGKKVVLVDAAEYAALKRRLAEVSDALEKISRGDAAYRQGRTKTVSSLAELGR